MIFTESMPTSDGSSIGFIIGMVIVAAVVLLIISALGYFIYR